MIKRLFLFGSIGIFLIGNLTMAIEAATISGTVSDSAGSPLNSIIVSMRSSAGVFAVAGDTTDEAGSYSLTCDSTSGTYIVSAMDPAGVYFLQYDSVALDGTDKAVDLTMALIKYATVSGVVTDSVTGTPIAGVIVRKGTRRADTTDAEGKYSVDSVATATTITFSSTGYIVKTLTPDIGDEAVTLDAALAAMKYCRVSGTVTDSAAGTPIEGAIVWRGTRSADTTDADGAYSLDSVATGTSISFSLTGYILKTLTPDIGDEAVTLDVALTAMKYCRVSGTVTDSAAGTPIEGIIVWRGTRSADTTDADGAYSLDSVATGTSISFSAPEYFTKTTTPDIGDDDLTLDIALVKKKICPVSGTVTDTASGTPIEGAIVWVGLSAKDTTDADGKYSIDTIATGDYLSVSAAGYLLKIMTPSVEDSAIVADFALVKLLYGSLTGTITDSATGAAIEGVAVRCGTRRDTTGADGKYALDSVATGTNFLSVSASGYTSKSSRLTVVEDSTYTIDFMLSESSISVRAAGRIAALPMVSVAADRLFFRSADAAGMIRLMDLKGATMLVRSFPANATTCLQLRLPTGVYIFKANWRDGSFSDRILVR